MKKLFKRVAVILTALLLFALSVYPAYAFDGTQQLHISFLFDKEPIPGAEISIYRIGDVSGGIIVPEGDFTHFPVNYNVSDTDKLSTLGYTLSAYVNRNKTPSLCSDLTNENGVADFDKRDFSGGAYLVITKKILIDDVMYFANPVIVLLPYGVNGVYSHTVNAILKTRSVLNSAPSIKLNVLKVWDDGGSSVRPKDILIELLQDGQVYDTVLLNDNNNWKAEWYDLSPTCEWAVIEKNITSDYTVTTELKGITFVVTNSKRQPEESTTSPTDPIAPTDPTESTKPTSPTDPTSPTGPTSPTTPNGTTTPNGPTTDYYATTNPTGPTKPPKEELPYTGTPIWQIPYWAIAGISLFIIGYIRYRKGELADEKS